MTKKDDVIADLVDEAVELMRERDQLRVDLAAARSLVGAVEMQRDAVKRAWRRACAERDELAQCLSADRARAASEAAPRCTGCGAKLSRFRSPGDTRCATCQGNVTEAA